MLFILHLLQDRVGGRVATFRKGNYVADLGAMVVTGLGKRLSFVHGIPSSAEVLQLEPMLFDQCFSNQ